MLKQGKLYVVTAPSGAGKSSLLKALIDRLNNVVVSVSYTTRPARPSEVEGIDYYFVTKESFESMIAEGKFLEYATVFPKIASYYYGTPHHEVVTQLNAGNNVVLEIDWQGAEQIFAKIPQQTIGIFILPPSLFALEARLIQRGEDNTETIRKRMLVAQDEVTHCRGYSYVVINDDFNQALAELTAIFTGKRKPIDWENAGLPPELSQLLANLLAPNGQTSVQ